MNQNKEKIVICGHYGSTNIGDEAILYSILENFKKVKPNASLTVLSYNPSNTKEYHNINSSYLIPLGIRSFFRGILKGELRKTLKIIKNCDKFILGGGGLFTDEKLFAVFLWGLHAFVALKYKKPLYMIGQSVGPLESRIGKWITKRAFKNATLISVRDSSSKQLLKQLGVNNQIYLIPDLAFSIEIKENKINENLNKKIAQEGLKGYFLISLRPWLKNSKISYKNIIRSIDNIAKNNKLLPVFLPFQNLNQNDTLYMHKLIEQNTLKSPYLINKFDQNIFYIFNLIKSSKFTIGMRLHFIIFSIINKIPFIALSYSNKIKNLLKDLSLEDQILISSDEGTLENKILKLINTQYSLNEKQNQYIQNAKKDILEFFTKI